MLTHEIKKPAPAPEPARAWDYGTRRPPPPQQQPTHFGSNWTAPPPTPRGSESYMEKIAFSKWVEGPDVKGKFAAGDYCTISGVGYVPYRIPTPLLLIDHVQEIHYLAPVDTSTKEPRCVAVKMSPSQHVIYYPPCRLRPLNSEELTLVNLRDQKTRSTTDQETGTPAQAGGTPSPAPTPVGVHAGPLRTAIIGGEVVVVDAAGNVVCYADDDPNELRAG